MMSKDRRTFLKTIVDCPAVREIQIDPDDVVCLFMLGRKSKFEIPNLERFRDLIG